MPGSCYVRASYEFANPEPGEIRLAIGDVVEVTGAVDDNWLTGRNHSQSSQVGNFPKNFVEPLELPCVKETQKVFLAMRSFHGEMAEDLSFRRGLVIAIVTVAVKSELELEFFCCDSELWFEFEVSA